MFSGICQKGLKFSPKLIKLGLFRRNFFLATFLRQNRMHLAFHEVGSQVNGQKPPIIFLHGAALSKESWKDVIRPIAEATGRKAYAYDARNHGDSEWSEDFDYEILGGDLLQFMDSVQAEKAVLIGHSMGGRTAMFFASKMPKRVEMLIAEDIPLSPAGPHLRKQSMKYLQLLRYSVGQIPPEIKDLEKAKNFVFEFFQDKIPLDQRSSRHGTADGSSLPLCQDEDGKFKWKHNVKVVEETFLTNPDETSISSVYPGPTLMLCGTISPYKVYDDREVIRRFFPASQFVPVEGANHQIHLEFADIFVKEVLKFMNKSRL